MFFEHAISVLGLALILEHFWGNPASPWYPANSFTGFANTIKSLVEKDSRLSGLFAWFLVVFASLSVFVTLWYHFAYDSTWLSIIFQALLLWMSLNWSLLIQNLENTPSLSTDPNHNNTLTTDTSKSMIAPLFYFTLFGVLGAWVYRISVILSELWQEPNKQDPKFSWFTLKANHTTGFFPLRLTEILIHIQRTWITSSPTVATPKQNIHTINHVLIMMVLGMIGSQWLFN